MRLRVDVGKVERKVGNSVASRVRRNLREGRDGDGSMLPTTNKQGTPLIDTGSLVKSVKFDRFRRAVRPVGKRDDAPALRNRQEGLLYVLIHNAREHRGREIDPMQPNPRLIKTMQKTATREIAKQLRQRKFGLFAELRRI